MAQFQINIAHASKGQKSFILFGQVTEGTIRTGMLAQIQFNQSFSMSEVIDRIEFARKADGTEDLCLCFDCDTLDELESWEDLNIGNEVINVLEPKS